MYMGFPNGDSKTFVVWKYGQTFSLIRMKQSLTKNCVVNTERSIKPILDLGFDFIVHLAAHAGVRDSFGKESEYHSNNIDGTQTMIEAIQSTG